MAINDVARKFAPLVVLHGDDKLRPSSAEWFIGRSTLRWATGRGLDGDPVPGAERRVDPKRLGAASADPYRVGNYSASALTRPLDDQAARQGDPPTEQGFFLRLRREASARGTKSASADRKLYTGVPTYYDYDERAKALTYWLFYPGSSPPLGVLRLTEQIGVRSRDAAEVPTRDGPPDEVEAAVSAAMLEEFRRAYPGLALEAWPPAGARGFPGDIAQQLRVVAAGVKALLRDDNVLHEGDWERITLYLDQAAPLTKPPAHVAYYRHATNTFRKWQSVRKQGTHPLVFCAIGSHASLPSPGFGFIDVGDPNGPRWETWKPENGVLPIEDQPWYGFGGAWGRLGKVRDATGPLGPGAHWKRAAPRPAQ